MHAVFFVSSCLCFVVATGARRLHRAFPAMKQERPHCLSLAARFRGSSRWARVSVCSGSPPEETVCEDRWCIMEQKTQRCGERLEGSTSISALLVVTEERNEG